MVDDGHLVRERSPWCGEGAKTRPRAGWDLGYSLIPARCGRLCGRWSLRRRMRAFMKMPWPQWKRDRDGRPISLSFTYAPFAATRRRRRKQTTVRRAILSGTGLSGFGNLERKHSNRWFRPDIVAPLMHGPDFLSTIQCDLTSPTHHPLHPNRRGYCRLWLRIA